MLYQIFVCNEVFAGIADGSVSCLDLKAHTGIQPGDRLIVHEAVKKKRFMPLVFSNKSVSVEVLSAARYGKTSFRNKKFTRVNFRVLSKKGVI